MTDEQIIKALECCTTPHTEVKCYCCKSTNDDICNKLNPTIILDLIRRQQAEINQFADIGKMYSEARADVVREFAEKLKENFSKLEYETPTTRKTLPVDTVKSQMGWVLHEVTTKEIDNLVNKMFGNSEELKGE